MSALDLLISTTSAIPLYEQIEKQIKEQILNGQIAQGEAMPSIRALAKELHVSVITAKRVEDDLEAEGLLETVAGKGTFVGRVNQQCLKEMALAQVEEKLAEAIDLALGTGVSKEELWTMINLLYDEEE